MLSLAYLAISTLVLAKAAEIVVVNAEKLSRYLGMGQVAVGMAFLAVVTSLPELSVAITSGVAQEGAISAGTVFGSNIANILLVLGMGAFLYGMKVKGKKAGEIALILLLTTVISAYIIFSSSVQGIALGFPAGAALLLIFAAYILHVLKRKKPPANGIGNHRVDKKRALRAFLVFVAGIIVVFISSGFVVENAILAAESFGLAQSLIGATVIAVGTSLPELSTTLQAVRKKKYGLAMGNAIGSNMANLTLVLGSTAVLTEIHVQLPVFIAALLFAVVANALLLYYEAARKGLGRYSGLLFLVAYIAFLALMLELQAGEIYV